MTSRSCSYLSNAQARSTILCKTGQVTAKKPLGYVSGRRPSGRGLKMGHEEYENGSAAGSLIARIRYVPQGQAVEHPAVEQGPGDDSEASARGGVAVSNADLEPAAQVCGRPVKGSLISASQDPVASCCVDHLSAGLMFWFPRKKFVGSYFCLSAASRW
jgi:hypothetical protein